MTIRLAGLVAALVAVLAVTACGDLDRDQRKGDRNSGTFVGLTLEAAGARADDQGRRWRIVELDGEPQAVTADFISDRLNFTVVDGVVTDAATDEELVAARE